MILQEVVKYYAGEYHKERVKAKGTDAQFEEYHNDRLKEFYRSVFFDN